MTTRSDPASIIRLVHAEIEEAVSNIMTEAETCLALINAAGQQALEDAAALSEGLSGIIRACMFQDLTGQRLVILADMLERQGAAGPLDPARDSLLNGPAAPGEGVDQAQVDQLLAGGLSPPPATVSG